MIAVIVLGALLALFTPETGVGAARPVRAAYFYHYMSVDHLDTLRAAGFDRAVVKWIADSLDAGGRRTLEQLVTRGSRLGIEVSPSWALQMPSRIGWIGTMRRYAWGMGGAEIEVGCPLDSLFWRTALLERASAFARAAPTIRHIVLDLEIYRGGLHHYAAACRCPACVREGLRGKARTGSAYASLQESRLEQMLVTLLRELRREYPKLEIGVFDLDRQSFVHRALGRALRRSGVRTADYCESSYGGDAGAIDVARARLRRLGLVSPVYGGVWLKRFPPAELPAATRTILERADGYFVFTTYSLSGDPDKLKGPYTAPGARADYWAAFRQMNAEP